MTNNKQTVIAKDLANKKLKVVREFAAPLEQVWKAWTESNLLDLWWAPKPWKAKTKSMDFREGGFWLYCMEGPDGTQSWARADFQTIVPQKSFTAVDSFCDENGNKNADFPSMHWKNEFNSISSGTKVEIEISFTDEADMTKILEMGFEEGFTAALGNLDELFLNQFSTGAEKVVS
ncbi:ATPase [Adhaeribacter arboris]|uniref:ATPase n=1 Tax=Adhaeribacter arboris TaxID=2072846 RepID=A0A2T2YG82_9BACT|nr:SRPBCC domain-containing protein [Adhaeribacter arboris]PSR54519.1 ATPase [Adhaeribacter arboris]